MIEHKNIITSPLDNDLYKFTMMQAVYHQFPTAKAKYKFKCRSNMKHSTATKEYIKTRLFMEIINLKKLEFDYGDTHVLRNLGHFKEDFLSFLNQRAVIGSSCKIDMSIDEEGLINVTYSGLVLDCILAEVPLLATISEIGLEKISAPYRESNFDDILENAINERLDFAKNHTHFRFSDFGTRRRYSFDYQDRILGRFKEASDNHETYALQGTSNVYFADKYKLICVGTHAHEFFQMMQAMTNIKNFQKYALQCWANEYRGNLGIALSDIVGMDAFLKDFDLYFSKLFDGCRHDSGNPSTWCNKLINHYKKMNINPLTKTAIFSDGLTFESGYNLQEEFHEKIKVGLGIGTYFTNNICDTIQPISMVIKIVECNGQPVVKISDSKGKLMCEDMNYYRFVKDMFNIGEFGINLNK